MDKKTNIDWAEVRKFAEEIEDIEDKERFGRHVARLERREKLDYWQERADSLPLMCLPTLICGAVATIGWMLWGNELLYWISLACLAVVLALSAYFFLYIAPRIDKALDELL